MTGRKLKEVGIKQAIDNAESKHKGWGKQALKFIKRIRRKRFMAEDVREFAYARGLPQPPHDRAWGAVFRVARSLGIIQHVGYGQVTNPKAHCANASVWEKV